MKRKKQTPPAVAPPPVSAAPEPSVAVAPIAPPRLPKGRAATSARRARTLAEAAEIIKSRIS